MLRFDVRPRLQPSNGKITVGEVNRGDHGLLGSLSELGRNTDVFMSFDFEHVVGVFGKRGSGKSYLLGAIAEALSWQEREESFSSIGRSRSAILFDLLNIYQWMASSDGRWVAKLYHVPGFPPPGAMSQEIKLRPQDIDPGDWAMLFGLDGIREPMGQCLSEAVALYRQKKDASLVSFVAAIESLRANYSQETIRAVTSRVRSYDSLGLFDPAGIDLASLSNERRLSIILFAGVPEDIRSLYVFLILRQVYEARVRESQIEKAAVIEGRVLAESGCPKVWLLVDEAQNIIPPRSSTYATDMLVRFVREGRNFGLSMCFTTQQPSAIDPKIMAQLDTVVSYTLTVPADVQTIVRNFKAPPPAEVKRAGRSLGLDEAIRELEVGQCVVSSIGADRTFFMATRQRVSSHGGFEV